MFHQLLPFVFSAATATAHVSGIIVSSLSCHTILGAELLECHRFTTAPSPEFPTPPPAPPRRRSRRRRRCCCCCRWLVSTAYVSKSKVGCLWIMSVIMTSPSQCSAVQCACSSCRMAAAAHTTVDTTATTVPPFLAGLSPASAPAAAASAAAVCCCWCCSHSLLRMLSMLLTVFCSEYLTVSVAARILEGGFHALSLADGYVMVRRSEE